MVMNQVRMQNDAIKRPRQSLKQCAKDEIREPTALKCDSAKPREREKEQGRSPRHSQSKSIPTNQKQPDVLALATQSN